jgi:hypothetical protein
MQTHLLALQLSFLTIFFLLLSNVIIAKLNNVTVFNSATRPSQIILLYITSFYFLGSLFFYLNFPSKERYMIESLYWDRIIIIVWFISNLLTIVLTSFVPFIKTTTEIGKEQYGLSLIFSIIAVFLSVFHYYFNNYILFFIIFAFIFLSFQDAIKLKIIPLIFSVCSVLILVPSSSASKRNLIFPILVICLLLTKQNAIKINTALLVSLVCFSLVVPFSIMRGYGNYGDVDFLGAVAYSFDYIYRENFWIYISSNFEFGPFYFHGNNAVMLFHNTGDYLWGETILRSVLSPFIYLNAIDVDSIFASSIEIYTQMYDPNFRLIGGSYPVNLFSEIFMNFGLVSVILFPILCTIIDVLYFKTELIENHRIKFALQSSVLFCLLLLIRGAGFSLFFFNILILFIPIVIMWPLIKTLQLRVSDAS